ncbi:hypothetical protein ACHAWF_015926 [Thalassiosira exigua]
MTSLAILAIGAATIAAESSSFAKPPLRYRPFDQLNATSQSATKKLGYLEVTWNNHGLAPVERERWTAPTSNERNAATYLGFVESTWNCFINHYEGYPGDGLAAEDVQ